MSKNFIYGLVIDGKFYSNRMFFPINHPNGIYSMDMDKDDFKSTLTTSDIDDAVKFFRKASKIKVIRGIAFHDGIIPENPVSYPSIPLKVKDATYDDFEEVEVAILQNGPCYFLRIVSTEKAFPLLEIKEALENRTSVEQIKGVSPDIRIAYTFSFIERERQKIEEERAKAAEKRKKDLENPTNYIKAVMEESGATVHNVKKVNRGFEVNWTVVGQRINSLFDVNFRVIEAGFCTTGHDRTQSAASVAKLLQDYVKERQHFSITRTAI